MDREFLRRIVGDEFIDDISPVKKFQRAAGPRLAGTDRTRRPDHFYARPGKTKEERRQHIRAIVEQHIPGGLPDVTEAKGYTVDAMSATLERLIQRIKEKS